MHPGTPAAAIGEMVERLGLAAYADRRSGTLSHGNKQRLGLAKALLHRPSLLILDEPSLGLDPAGIVEVREFLVALTRQGVTVFMSSHILAEVARLAGRVGILHQGRLLQEMDASALEKQRKRRLLLRVRDPGPALDFLRAGSRSPELLPDGTIVLNDAASVAGPDELNTLLVRAGTPPMQLMVEEEDLEQYFLRLVGSDRVAST
jgi:ABC-2 type transport system ATP-binding protein